MWPGIIQQARQTHCTRQHKSLYEQEAKSTMPLDGKLSRTILAGSVSIACLGEKVKACDWRKAHLRAFNNIIELGVDKVWDAVACALQTYRTSCHAELRGHSSTPRKEQRTCRYLLEKISG